MLLPLVAACRELQQFSLPGVGTFVRVQEPARLDPVTRMLHPPRERLQLIAGRQENPEALLGFWVAHYRTTPAEAQREIEQLSEAVVRELKTYFRVDLPTIGQLKRNPDGTYFLELINNDPTLQTFGLRPVAALELPENKKNQLRFDDPESNAETNVRPPVSLAQVVLLLVIIVLLLGSGIVAFNYRYELGFTTDPLPPPNEPAAQTDTVRGQDINNAAYYNTTPDSTLLDSSIQELDLELLNDEAR